MYINHCGVGDQHGLKANHGCLDVEVVEWPGASGERSSSIGRRDKCLLAEAEYAELVGDEVQTFKEEGLVWFKDGRNPYPNRWERGKLQRAEASHIA